MAGYPNDASSARRAALSPELYSVADITRPDRRLLGLYALRTLALCLLGPWFLVALLPLYFKYRTLRYRFDEEGVTMSWGLMWRREIHLTYARIQDIHVSRGLIERWLGLATIHVQTASGNAGAEMSLVGLTEHDLIRDYLYYRMRGMEEPFEAEAHEALDGVPRGRASSGAEPTTSGDALALLERVLDETRGLRRALESRATEAVAPRSESRDEP